MITHFHRCSIGIRCITFAIDNSPQITSIWCSAMRCDSLGIMSIAQMNHFNESINLLLAFKCFELNLWLFLPLSIFDFRYDYPSFGSGRSVCTYNVHVYSAICMHALHKRFQWTFLSFPLCTPVLWLLILVLCVRVLLQLNTTILFLLVSISTQFYTSRSAVRIFCILIFALKTLLSIFTQYRSACLRSFRFFFLLKWHSSSHTE